MRDGGQASEIVKWLAAVRLQFVHGAPELIPIFETYAEEALFGRGYIDSDLRTLALGSKILEVGAGSMLLSCQLMREGFDVTSLEPTGQGFSHFGQMRQIILNIARSQECCPALLEISAENLAAVECFDYAFSINVMEHVDDVARVLETVGKSLSVGARYRFTCPNYLFPYEPHFNIPTAFSKLLTERLLGRKIFSSQRVSDPVGIWRSLNWINVIQIKRYVHQMSALRVTFNRSMLVATLARIVTDPNFAARRSPGLRRFLAGLVQLRLHQILSLIPVFLQPIIDCHIQKISNQRM